MSPKRGHGPILACPHCDDSGVYRRNHNGNAFADDPTKDWYCYECKTAFDEPIKREPKVSVPPNRYGNGPNDPEDRALIERVREKLGVSNDES